MGKNTPKPHDRLSPEPAGDTDVERIYAAVGFALTQWEYLNSSMVLMFIALVSSDNVALMRAFGTLDTTIPRANMMLAASEVSLIGHDELRRRTKDLLNEVIDFAHRRNDIAHGAAEIQPSGLYLSHGADVTKKIDLKKSDMYAYRWTAAQIRYYAHEFIRLRTETETLWMEIRVVLTQP